MTTRPTDWSTTKFTVPGQTGVYWTDDEERHGKSPYSGYFTSRTIDLTEEQYAQICGGRSWRNYTPGDSYWSNRDDENTSQDGHENDRYSLRFGTLPEGDTITMALFKKYKGGGLLSEASWGRLSIVSVEAPLGEKGKYTVSGGYLLDISINDGANTWEVSLLPPLGYMGQGMVQVSKDGNPIMPSRVMVNYKHADQDTKHYGHDSHAVIFPFGK